MELKTFYSCLMRFISSVHIYIFILLTYFISEPSIIMTVFLKFIFAPNSSLFWQQFLVRCYIWHMLSHFCSRAFIMFVLIHISLILLLHYFWVVLTAHLFPAYVLKSSVSPPYFTIADGFSVACLFSQSLYLLKLDVPAHFNNDSGRIWMFADCDCYWI